ncbi:MAG: FixH family protein [Candidatus Nitrosotenuis sp.]
MGAILGYTVVSSEIVYAEKQSMSMSEMCQTMMNQAPQDVTIFPKSGQVAFVDKESSIVLLVKDKKTNKPLDNADVILHIEKGAPMESMGNMSMMDMMGRMFEAENIGDGKYVVTFTPDEKGYYTMHTHAIPPGKSMMSMMNNHMDIGIIAK